MQRSRLVLALLAPALLAGALAGPLADGASARHSRRAPAHARGRAHANGVRVSVRVEGARSTLLPEKVVLARARRIDPNGKRADSCEGDTVAVALQDATHGRWEGTYDSGLGYTVERILGEWHPFSSDYYWSLWLDGKPATAGICTATLHRGERILFFPQCSKESASQCPHGLFDPPVLAISGPKRARVGRPVTVKVAELANASGAASPAAGVKLRAGGRTVTTDSSGRARLRFAKAGRFQVVAEAPGAIRDELTVEVRR